MSKPYRPRDHYFKKAKREGFRARSAFKIEEIATRFRLVRKGARVLDLGAAPGGFLQVLAELVGPSGTVVGIDIVPIKPIGRAQVKTAVLDVRDEELLAKLDAIDPAPFDAVISDMAPKTTGIRSTDEARSAELARIALAVAEARLAKGGGFVAKLFMGGEFEPFRKEMRQGFTEVKVVRPEATRGGSFEVYLVGLGRK